jgi:aryl-alcohol dehydrogenase-like predicted oxidoreductase
MAMERRRLGQSEVEVTAIIFGAWAIGGFMWGGTDDEAGVEAVRRGIELGVTSIDTAPVYGFGHSEEVVGRAIPGRREEVQLLTKFGMSWEGEEGTFSFETLDEKGRPARIYRNGRKQRVIAECEQSLRRLGTDVIDVYQQHWPDPSTPVEETCEALARLLEQGKIRAAAVCNYPVDLLDRARTVVPIASDQMPYSMVNRAIEQDLVPYCRQRGVGILAYSPLQRGLLTGTVPPEREFPTTDHRRTNPYFTAENRQRVLELLQQFQPIADAHGATLAQLVIAWTLARPGITAVLVGARNRQQIEENVRGAEVSLSAEETARIDEALEGFALAL